MLGIAILGGIGRLAVLALVEHPETAVVHWRYGLVELDVFRRYLWMMIVPTGQSIFHQIAAIDSLLDAASVGRHRRNRAHDWRSMVREAIRWAGDPRRLLVFSAPRSVGCARHARLRRADGRAPCLSGGMRALAYWRIGGGLARAAHESSRSHGQAADMGRSGGRGRVALRTDTRAKCDLGRSGRTPRRGRATGPESLAAMVAARAKHFIKPTTAKKRLRPTSTRSVCVLANSAAT